MLPLVTEIEFLGIHVYQRLYITVNHPAPPLVPQVVCPTNTGCSERINLGCTVRSVGAVNVVHAAQKMQKTNRMIAVCQKYINIGV